MAISYRTSGARDTIFIKPLPRSSRATGPKIRVPTGSPSKANPYLQQPGGIVEKEMPIHVSNVMVMCDACASATKVGYRYTEDGKKIRFCKKCNEIIG